MMHGQKNIRMCSL